MEDALFVAIPTRHGIRAETSAAITDTVIEIKRAMPKSVISYLPGCSDIRIARSDLAYVFLKSECTKMLFIDDDLLFSKQTVGDLFNAHGDIVCAAYQKRMPPHGYALLLEQGQKHPREAKRRKEGDNVFLEVMAVGCGLMMIDRRVIEGLYAKHKGTHLDYYTVEEERRCLIFQAENWLFGGKFRAMGEDFSFCLRAREAGFKVEVIVNAETDHAGVKGNLVEFFPELLGQGKTNDMVAQTKIRAGG